MKTIESRASQFMLSIIVIFGLMACTVGPVYKTPEAQIPDSFDQSGDDHSSIPMTADLWSAFSDPALDELLTTAQENNKSIAQANARLEEARAVRGLIIFSWFPTVTANTERTKSGYSDLDPLLPNNTADTDIYKAGFDASWEIDIFGSLRQQSNAIRSEAAASESLLAALRLSINAEVAQTYFSYRGTQAQLEIQSRNIDNLKQTEQILEALLREGRGTELELSQTRSLTLQLEAQVPNTEAELVRQTQRLAVLTAQPLASVREQLAVSSGMPVLPVLKAIGTPEEWIKRRPDVLAAEQQFAAANARVGVNVADYFPVLNLTGSFAWTAQSFSGLGNQNAENWDYGPSLNWNFLNIGRIRQNVRAAEARADAAAHAYQEAVLLALEDAENALAIYRASNQSQQSLFQAVEQSRKARDLAKLRYENGAIDFLSLLDTERTLLSVENSEVQAKTTQAVSLALLYKALAGDFATSSL